MGVTRRQRGLTPAERARIARAYGVAGPIPPVTICPAHEHSVEPPPDYRALQDRSFRIMVRNRRFQRWNEIWGAKGARE